MAICSAMSIANIQGGRTAGHVQTEWACRNCGKRQTFLPRRPSRSRGRGVPRWARSVVLAQLTRRFPHPLHPRQGTECRHTRRALPAPCARCASGMSRARARRASRRISSALAAAGSHEDRGEPVGLDLVRQRRTDGQGCECGTDRVTYRRRLLVCVERSDPGPSRPRRDQCPAAQPVTSSSVHEIEHPCP
jgi:hypothetical protein